MLMNLLIGLPVMALCLALQSLLVTTALRYYANHRQDLKIGSLRSTLAVINSVMLLLLLGNIGQILLWALLFQWLDEFGDLRTALYHSAVNFASLGYGDIVMSERHRLLGPLEAVNGMLMLGISTASLMTAMQDALRRTVQAQPPQ